MNRIYIEREIAIAIYNDDYSGMSNEDMDAIENFMLDNEYTTLIVSDDYSYEKCEVTNKYADCIKCILK